MAKQQSMGAAQTAMAGTSAFFDIHLEGRAYMFGNRVTVTDFAVGALSALALNPQSRVPLEGHANIIAWYQRLEAVPSWSMTAPARLMEAAE
ncbi:glutathione binding-like protein [Roseibium aggregatum]|uniref:glutathione binding-like protein n=2 Tax=Roseibium aggregatum TaxID=187304 RepID=UPI001E590239|nr:glutathione binding-like protein [Roseibium aggregatum]UES43828.1 hypothetical protein GFK90_08585 [Roseibium aggregatum]